MCKSVMQHKCNWLMVNNLFQIVLWNLWLGLVPYSCILDLIWLIVISAPFWACHFSPKWIQKLIGRHTTSRYHTNLDISLFQPSLHLHLWLHLQCNHLLRAFQHQMSLLTLTLSLHLHISLVHQTMQFLTLLILVLQFLCPNHRPRKPPRF